MGTAGRMKSSTLNRCSLFTLIRKKSRVRDFDVTFIVTYWYSLSIGYAVAATPVANTITLIVDAVADLNRTKADVVVTFETCVNI